MKKIFQKLFSIFTKTDSRQKRNSHKTRGQSLVELAIAFPLILMLFSGVIEFGFILNYYLSLLDATREAARYWSGGDPDDDNFYQFAAGTVYDYLDPTKGLANSSYVGRRITLDGSIDDVIISVYSVYTDDTIILNPWDSTNPASGAYHMYTNGLNDSVFHANSTGPDDTKSIESRLVPGSPNAGILVVEVHYNYHQVLNLPWFEFADPMPLTAYTIMPMRAAEPDVDEVP